MPALTLSYGTNQRIMVGYRTPQVSNVLSPSQKIILAKDLGMEVIEPSLAIREFPTLDHAKEMRQAADDMEIRVPSIGLNLPLTEPDADEAMKKALDLAVEYCGILGATYAFSRAMNPPEGIPQAKTWETFGDRAHLAAETLGKAGIQFAIEADPPCFIHTLERLELALAAADHPNCYPNYDPTNFYVVGSDPLRAIFVLGDRIHSGHIKDGVYRTNLKKEIAIGCGEVDYFAIFSEFIRRAMSVRMFLEHCKSPQEVRSGAEQIRKVFDQIAR
ncbi:MAG: sugar phosphate isomerase/epimerase [Candidatus Sumerlaeota bacterium]|nr:sugar phosphate isomerase/epimerase [Candidatus Sumerlaeota bacterium]